MTCIDNQTFDQERAFYGSQGLTLRNCAFDGPADGESAVKECSDITVQHCFCNLRYPFWHVRHLELTDSTLTELCRAALWYSSDITIRDTRLHGIKALRECDHAWLERCDIRSPEFGWSVRHLTMLDCTAESEYFLLRSEDLHLERVQLQGKYSFQYLRNATITNCILDTKDAFWHAQNVTVRDSIVKGEYLAWYADGLTFENCTIIGTQPLCYCKNLRLIHCKMIDTDLCFEKSQVEAEILTPVVSIKNPESGTIRVPAVGELLLDDPNAKGCVQITGTDNTDKEADAVCGSGW